ncbi:MAG TPA: hydroxymethylbilane synthase [Pyrinomonadaceae bacterium]|nr:hydroxymethylbilane synthase [Pyrinomonadaceae bacterium]
MRSSSSKRNLIIGSRGSELALWQTNFVKAKLEEFFPALNLEIKIIKTTGDRLLDVALAKIGDKGLFTRQIETALLNGEIDLAVHSLKDLQTVQPEGLEIGAVSARETPNDVLIAKNAAGIDDLPRGARVATGSLRRKSQLLNYRPDLRIFEIRGNVPTRLKKFEESDLDAMILAFAGVHRLGLDAHVKQIIPFEIMLPAVSQGAMGVEIRAGDAELKKLLRPLNDEAAQICVTAERSFLRRLEGGCQVPIGAYAFLKDDKIHLEGMAGSLNGSVNLRDAISGEKENAAALGKQLAENLIARGADKLLDETRQTVEKTKEAVI